jgi:general stress protein YciG
MNSTFAHRRYKDGRGQPAAGRGGFICKQGEQIMASSNQGNKQGGNQSNSQSAGGTRNRGFASMDPQRQREIASQGGKAAHQKGTAHEFTSEEARRAGSMSHGNRQSASAGSGSSSRSSSKTGGRGSKE